MPDEFYFDMIASIQEVAKINGYSLLLEYSEDDIGEEIKIIKNAKKIFVDGLLMISLNFTEEHISEINKSSIPVVLSSICNNKNVWHLRY